MEQTIPYLIGASFIIGFGHTITGPDHYLPFVALSKTGNWSNSKTFWVVLICGLAHVLSSVILGFIGIIIGLELGKLEAFEGIRGSYASWLLFTIGIIYTVWAIIQRIRKPVHTHSHLNKKKTKTFWILFTIFIFGPCEPLIPLLMYPASMHNIYIVILVSTLFSIVTISTMLVCTFLVLKGINLGKLHFLEKYQHILAGSTLALCGAAIIFLGL